MLPIGELPKKQHKNGKKTLTKRNNERRSSIQVGKITAASNNKRQKRKAIREKEEKTAQRKK